MRGLPFLLVALLAGERVALANGRFPLASQLIEDSSDPNHLVLRATYGVLTSRSAGREWAWICEERVGYSGTFDPAIAILSGAIIAGLPDGASRTEDDGCNWSRLAPVAGAHVIDLARRSDTSAVALTSQFILATDDAGRSWQQVGSRLPEALSAETVEVAQSDPARLYVGGAIASPSRRGVVLRSRDRGLTWDATELELHGGRAAFVAAVDPRNADRVWVRIDSATSDALLVSDDGGSSFREVTTTAGDMLGLALSPDGSKIAVGGPTDGVLIAATSDHRFEPRAKLAVRCLTWTTRGLYACATESNDGFAVALSKDDGVTFAPLHHLADSRPLACAAAACAASWPSVSAALGIRPSEAPPPEPGPSAEAARGCGFGASGPALFGVGLALLAIAARRFSR
jgi:hypothetical protein